MTGFGARFLPFLGLTAMTVLAQLGRQAEAGGESVFRQKRDN